MKNLLKLTPYGYSTIAKMCVLFIAILAVAYIPDLPGVVVLLLTALAVALLIFTVQFFRDPERTPPNQPNIVVSPADGKVVLVKEVDHEFFNGKAKMVSVFMSPLNVHVNRNPISGKVTHVKYIEGQYIAAFDHNAGERNERTEIGIENGRVKVFFKQISGFVARRIICDLKEGDEVKIGERFGMIKFGSRVDIFLPTNVKLNVKVGDTATAGETIIATYP
ncbi:MAG: phosphatidylserine decarboxylase [Chloroherpetonaceae bacterium]